MPNEERLLAAAIDKINGDNPTMRPVTTDDIIAHRFIPGWDVLAVVVNRGILGSPKYTIPLVDLAQPHLEPKPKSSPVDEPTKAPAKRRSRKASK